MRHQLESLSWSRLWIGPQSGECQRQTSDKERRKKHPQEVVDLEKLQDIAIKDEYRVEVENKFETLFALEEEATPDELWITMKDTLLDTANSVLGRRKKMKTSHGSVKTH